MSISADPTRPNLRRTSPDGYPQPGLYPLRPLRIGEIFGGAFRIGGRNLKVLLPFAAVASVLGTAVQLLVLAATGELTHVVRGDINLPTGRTPTNAEVSSFLHHELLIFAAAIAGALITFFGTVATSAIAVTLVTDAALAERTPHPLRRLKGRYGAALIATLLTLLATVAGLILLIVPGIILALTFYVSAPAAVMEGGSARAAMRRSAALTKGYRSRLFGISFLAELIAGGIALAVGVVIASIASGWVSGQLSTTGYIVLQLVVALLTAFLSAWSAVVTGLLYVDLRMRKEDLGRTLWSHAIEQAGQQVI